MDPRAITQHEEITEINDDDFFEIVDSSEVNKSLQNKKVKASTARDYLAGVGTDEILYTYQWDMFNNASIVIPLATLGITDIELIKTVYVTVKSEATTGLWNLQNDSKSTGQNEPDGSWYFDTTNMYLDRLAGGLYDDAALFSSPTFDRGTIFIELSTL